MFTVETFLCTCIQKVIYKKDIDDMSLSFSIRKYLTDSLKVKKSFSDIFIFYYHNDEKISYKILKLAEDARSHLQNFFQVSFTPKIVIFLYPNQFEMEKAFERPLPNDHCCFVPVKGETSLITFTSKINQKSLNQILVHEISHIFFTNITGNYEINDIQQIMPVWLDEGLALYLDSQFRYNMKKIEERRFSLFTKHSTDYFPNLTQLYTYFNHLDSEKEFGIRGQMAYAYSYFCVVKLIKTFGERRIVDFIKFLSPKKNFSDIFFSFFQFSLETFNEKMKQFVIEHDKSKSENFSLL